MQVIQYGWFFYQKSTKQHLKTGEKIGKCQLCVLEKKSDQVNDKFLESNVIENYDMKKNRTLQTEMFWESRLEEH